MADTSSDFLQRFFEQRPALQSKPDGRRLYGYRLDDGEFRDLEQTLKQLVSEGQSCRGESAALFVLYAAEWWRRHYDGGTWRWDPILLQIGGDWPHAKVRQCVEDGLRYWCLQGTRSGGLRYLGAIARQGGLPVALLAEARGRIGQLLGRVLQLAGSGSSRSALRSWVESLSDRLPTSYQGDATVELLTDLTATVLQLVQQANVKVSEGATTQLDTSLPRWREELPLRMEDTQTEALIEQLIGDAVAVPPQRPAEVSVERWLEPGEVGEEEFWTLRSSLQLPAKLENDALTALFPGLDQGVLGRSPTLSVAAGENTLEWPLQRLTGHEAYRVSRSQADLSGAEAAALHRIGFRDRDGTRYAGSARRGEALSDDLPWLFEEQAGPFPVWARQGGGGVRSESTILAVPEGWSVIPDDAVGATVAIVAYLEAPLRELYRLSGRARVMDGEGHTWTIRTAQAEALSDDFHWHGERYWVDAIRPDMAFCGRGRPHLYNGDSPIDARLLEWRPEVGSNGCWGPTKASYIEAGEVRHRAHLLFLPEQASVRLESAGPHGGSIHLEGWQAESARLVPGQGVELTAHHSGHALALDVWLAPDAPARRAPAFVLIDVGWADNPQIARMRFSFPAKGVRAFDGRGMELQKGYWLPIQALMGTRLIAVGVTGPLNLSFEVRRPHERLTQGARIGHSIKGGDGAAPIEIRLRDYAADISQLLAVEDLLDAWVELRLTDRHTRELYTLRLSRYAAALDRDNGRVVLRPPCLEQLAERDLTAIQLRALRLESPADEPIDLTHCSSEGVPVGAWPFEPSAQEPGSWLIYSAPDSPVLVRPILWPVESGCGEEEGDYAAAIGMLDRKARQAALDELIEGMASDFLDPAWSEVERLASHLSHLPLVTMDLWRRFAHSPRGMAALVLRLGDLPEGFALRFTDELPFDWTLVPYRSWRDAAERLRIQCERWFGVEIAVAEQRRQLDHVIEALTCSCPALGKLLGILRCVALDETGKEFSLMRKPETDALFERQLFTGDEPAIQTLLRHHAADTEVWPTDPDISQKVKQLRESGQAGTDLLCHEYRDYHDGVINLPLLLALRCVLDSPDCVCDGHPHIRAIREYRAFDPDWFDTAFDLTIGRCLSRGLFEP